MRENRTSGSEGGEAQINELSLPLSLCHPTRCPVSRTLRGPIRSLCHEMPNVARQHPTRAPKKRPVARPGEKIQVSERSDLSFDHAGDIVLGGGSHDLILDHSILEKKESGDSLDVVFR